MCGFAFLMVVIPYGLISGGRGKREETEIFCFFKKCFFFCAPYVVIRFLLCMLFTESSGLLVQECTRDSHHLLL